MKRIQTHLSEQQIEKLDKLAEKTGIKRAEHIRRAVDKYIKEEKTDKE